MAKSYNQSIRLNHKLYQSIIQIACMGLLMISSVAKAELIITYDATEESERTGFFDDGTVTSAELGDNTGTTIGEARRIVVETAVAYWNDNLEVNSEISFGVKFASLTCAASGYVVGSTTSYSSYYGDDNIVYPRSLYYNLTGSSGTAMDLKFNSNFGSNVSTACENASWYYGIDQEKPSSAYVTDLYYTALHEIAHGLGIAAKGFESSSGKFINGSAGGIFVNNLLDTTTNKRWGDADTTNAERLASITNGANTLVWGGAEVKRIVDSASLLSSGTTDDYPIMYAPGTYSSGSSLSHFDTSLSYSSLATGTNELMEPFITDSEDDILSGAILTDIGWIVTMDSDGDGTADPSDAFPVSEAADTDVDGDGLPDDWLADCDVSCQTASGLTLDDDDDNDSISDGIDNCPATANADQGDHDSDGMGDVCDTDGDNDGVLTAVDNCPLGDLDWTSNASNDIDGDGCQDSSAEENDYDNDGVDDSVDSDPNNQYVCSDNDNDGFDDCRTGNYDLDLDSDLDADGADYDEDIDADGDGLIEISTLADLNSMRDDLAGTSLSGGTVGCNPCNGYELVSDLDFDTDESGAIDSADGYWNTGKGWEPVGSGSNSFTGIFDGNGHTISNLYIDRDNTDADRIGLFGYAVGAEIHNIGLTGNAASITADTSDYVGALIGYSSTTTVSLAFSTVDINHSGFGDSIGGLIGKMYEGSLSDAYTSGNIRSAIDNYHYIGGVVGENYNGTISNIYSIASVLENPEDTPNKGGALVGLNEGGVISDSYWNTSLTSLEGTNSDSNNNIVSGITVLYDGLSTADMQCPQAPSDSACGTTTAYQNWGTTNWDFGTNSQYPALMLDSVSLREPDASPIISAPADQTAEATGATTTVDLGTAIVTDAEDGTLTATVDNSGPFAVGIHTITWSATDSAGNTATATQTVTITDTTVPVITTPINQTLEATGESTSVTIDIPSASDLVDGTVSVSVNSDNLSSFTVGVHTLTWTATDAAGNSATADQTITITDSTAPTVTAPSDVIIEATGSTTMVYLLAASTTDLVDGSLTATADNAGPFALGSHTITWSATDSAGNTGSDTQTITIQDTTSPTVVAPNDQSVEATGTTTTVSLGTASATDLVDGNPTITSDQSGSFAYGTHTVVWTATDASGNTATANQTVNITDPGIPDLVAPNDITVEATGATTAVTFETVSAVDLLEGTLIATADNTGPFTVGTHTITWAISNSRNGVSTATQLVTIADTTAPQITVPSNINANATGQTTDLEIGTATANDIVDGTVVVTSNSEGSFPVGVTTIIWTATDVAGNTVTSEQTVTIVDSGVPSVTAPADQTVEATGVTTVVTLGSATASDVVDGVLTAAADNSGPFTLGTHIITWSTTDSAGNTGSDTQTLVIQDTTAPTVSAPADQSVEATGTTTTVSLGTASATDLVDGNPAITADQSGPFAYGTHTVVWTATDASGNTATANQTVNITDPGIPDLVAPNDITVEATGATTAVTFETVSAVDLLEGTLIATADNTGPFTVGTHTITWAISNSRNGVSTATQLVTITDTTAPVITTPINQTLEATGENTSVSVDIPTATDLVDGAVSASVNSDGIGSFPVGVHTLTWTATDAAGNSSTADQTITITDTSAPSVIAPADQTAEATGITTTVALGSATSSDLVDGTLTATADNSGPFTLGTHTITWSATDSAGNTGSDTQVLVIQDTTAPTVTAPANQSVSATGALTTISIGSATASDLVDTNPSISADQTGPFAPGTHTIVWTATDASSNAATAEQTIIVTDNGAPSVTAPSNISKEATGATTAVTLGSATATDSVDGTITATADNTGPFTVGTHTVTWTATDSGGNSATATQIVTISDTTAPQIIAPGNIAINATGTSTQTDIGTAIASDLVDGVVTTISDSQGSFPVGVTTITWTATDAAGNSSTATQTVTITDGDGPEITAPVDINVEATGTTTSVNLGDATATDTVDGELIATADNQGPFTVGSHTVTWTATDSAGNTSTATQVVIVEDTTAPEISTEFETLELDATGVLTPITEFGITATDLVDGNTVVTGSLLVSDSLEDLPAGFASGTHLLIWKATDNAGNTSSITQALAITPQTNFSNTQAVSAGDEVTVNVELTGEAITYPVTIPYSIDTTASTVVNDGADHDASDGIITIESGTSGNFTFNIADNPALNGTGQGELIFNMGSPSNAVEGSTTTHKVTISADNIAPVVAVAMTQNSLPVTKVSMDAGNVLITAIASDSDAQTLSYDWSQSDSTLVDLATDQSSNTFELDPSVLASGTYTVIIEVSDNGSPIASTTIATSFKVVEGTSVVVDTDGDGVEDTKDNVSEPNRLAADEGVSDSYILESESGTVLKLGDVALEQEAAVATVEETELPEIPTEYEATATEIYDFKISGVAHGESVLVVLPQHNAIPADAVYLKSDGSTWKAFVEDANNILYSAPGTGTGICPSAGDSAYTTGLTEGDFCLQLKIEDGGDNDTDGQVNGVVADPGTIVSQATSTGSGITTSSGGGSLSWFMLPLFLLLGLRGHGVLRRYI